MHHVGVQLTQTLGLDNAALNARHHGPDVAEGQTGEHETPDQRQGDAQDGRQTAVAAVLGPSESDVATFPHTLQAVAAGRLGDDVIEVHLKHTETGQILFLFLQAASSCL